MIDLYLKAVESGKFKGSYEEFVQLRQQALRGKVYYDNLNRLDARKRRQARRNEW